MNLPKDFHTLNSDQQRNALKKIEINIYKNSLFDTAKYLLGYKDLSWDTHGRLCQTLESASKRKLIVMPRGCFKSSIASVAYPIWLLLNNPNLRIMIDSEVYENSRKFLREIKAHLLSHKVVSLFGDLKGSTWTEGEIVLSSRTINKKEASITCSGIGAQKTSQHYDFCVGDDLNSPKNSLTPEACSKVIDHFRMYTSLLDPGGTIVIIGTRYSEMDVIGHILDTDARPLDAIG